MKTPSLLALALLFLTSVTLRAEVVIYKGPARLSTDLESSTGFTGGVVGLYLVEFQHHLIARITLRTFNGQKKVIKGTIQSAQFANAPLKGGKTAVIISTVTTAETDDIYRDSVTLLRGTYAPLLVQQNPGPVMLRRPRTLTVVSASYFGHEGTVFSPKAHQR